MAYKAIMLDRIEGRLEARTPDALAAAIGSLISEGVVVPGDKLPTVRLPVEG